MANIYVGVLAAENARAEQEKLAMQRELAVQHELAIQKALVMQNVPAPQQDQVPATAAQGSAVVSSSQPQSLAPSTTAPIQLKPDSTDQLEKDIAKMKLASSKTQENGAKKPEEPQPKGDEDQGSDHTPIVTSNALVSTNQSASTATTTITTTTAKSTDDTFTDMVAALDSSLVEADQSSCFVIDTVGDDPKAVQSSNDAHYGVSNSQAWHGCSNSGYEEQNQRQAESAEGDDDLEEGEIEEETGGYVDMRPYLDARVAANTPEVEDDDETDEDAGDEYDEFNGYTNGLAGYGEYDEHNQYDAEEEDESEEEFEESEEPESMWD